MHLANHHNVRLAGVDSELVDFPGPFQGLLRVEESQVDVPAIGLRTADGTPLHVDGVKSELRFDSVLEYASGKECVGTRVVSGPNFGRNAEVSELIVDTVEKIAYRVGLPLVDILVFLRHARCRSFAARHLN